MIQGVATDNRGRWQNPAALVVAGLLWGSTYVVVKSSLGAVSASVLMLVRFAIATVTLGPWLVQTGWPRSPEQRRATVRGGWELGLWLAFGHVTHTIALQYTTAGRSAFITALYVTIVPLLMGIMGQRVRPKVWLATMIATTGVALLSYDGAPPNAGDLWSVLTALAWAVYIWRMETFAPQADLLWMSAIQLAIVTVVAGLWVTLVGNWAIDGSQLPWLDLVYLGAIATAGTAWLQAIGQRSVAAPVAAVLYTLEPVWAALLAAAWLGERLGGRGLVGAALVVAACLLCQLPVRSLLSRRRSGG